LTDLDDRIRERIHRFGPISFAEYMGAALYDDDGGFFAVSGEAGRRGDFVTSPELGPLFGTVIARALDTWWQELGRPDPYFVIEAGAGSGALARAVLEAGPTCGPALRYVLVERSERLRSLHASSLPLEPPAWVLGPPEPGADPDEELHVAGTGPVAVSLPDLPALDVTGVIIANELLDNLPFLVVERTDDGWCEVRVGDDDGAFVEVLVPASPELAGDAERLAPDAATGSRIPLQHEAASWLRRALGTLRRGRVVVVDYAADTATLAGREGWLRTYRGHHRGDGPLAGPGTQDITADVALDQLGRVAEPGSVVGQAEFLRAHGLDGLVDAASAAARASAASGGLEHLAARSRLSEARALTDPGGLGGFTVAQWTVPSPLTP
jgi:SAM-dependent MidA family methyltransferase